MEALKWKMLYVLDRIKFRTVRLVLLLELASTLTKYDLFLFFGFKGGNCCFITPGKWFASNEVLRWDDTNQIDISEMTQINDDIAKMNLNKKESILLHAQKHIFNTPEDLSYCAIIFFLMSNYYLHIIHFSCSILQNFLCHFMVYWSPNMSLLVYLRRKNSSKKSLFTVVTDTINLLWISLASSS
ncbi:hypothetical protein ACJX0J_008324 [Zea mays]